jgi:hypothetical protein
MYADDIVIFSESKDGLQQSLNKLNQYCQKWALQVNASKTKAMVINGKEKGAQFSFGADNIEVVSAFKYLGIEFSDNGDMKVAKKDLSKRALKAYFSLTRSLDQNSVKPDVMLHLFDHLIKPVLSYGCEIWGPLNFALRQSREHATEAAKFYKELRVNFPLISKYVDNECPLEKVHLTFCRHVLGVHNKATNMAVYGDLGRVPLFIDHIVACVKYYFHLQFSHTNALLQQFYTTMCQKEPTTYTASLAGFAEHILK